ncbi:transposable element Tcb1 transposase [Trichonephila clavipes]|nr:transposable element Tcb1 transposase [Trichonephila clavipes]
MPRHRIRMHYEQLLEFERGRIIGLKEGGWTNRRIACHMDRSDAAIKRFCQTLPCPARSPDLSPIEHVWDMKGRRLHLPGIVDDLARQLMQIWQEIAQLTIMVLYHSMSRRVAACI